LLVIEEAQSLSHFRQYPRRVRPQIDPPNKGLEPGSYEKLHPGKESIGVEFCSEDVRPLAESSFFRNELWKDYLLYDSRPVRAGSGVDETLEIVELRLEPGEMKVSENKMKGDLGHCLYVRQRYLCPHLCFEFPPLRCVNRDLAPTP